LWCPLWFPRKIDVRFGSCCISVICIYLRILMSNTSSCLAESASPSGLRLFSGFMLLDHYLSVYCFIDCCFCPFVIFRFTFVLSVLWFTSANYTCGIFKLFSLDHAMFSIQENKQRFNMKLLCYTTIYGLLEFDITM
jgi:hypothetical protein